MLDCHLSIRAKAPKQPPVAIPGINEKSITYVKIICRHKLQNSHFNGQYFVRIRIFQAIDVPVGGSETSLLFDLDLHMGIKTVT